MDTATWAIVIFPELPLEQRRAIDRIRAAYDPLATALDPHITLVFPFTATLPLAELLAHTRMVAASVAPFGIELHDITGQQDEWLFLNVKRGNDQLVALHDQLYSGQLASYREPRYTYVPHVTVGRVAPGAVFEAALRETAGFAETLRTTVRAITVYRIADDDTRDERYDISLSPEREAPSATA